MRKLLPLSFLLCARFLNAQSPSPVPAILSDPISAASRQMEMLHNVANDHSLEQARQAAILREQEFARTQFLEKANQFVALWEDFASRLNEKQTFDAKLAKKLAKAFHELETSEGWPVRELTTASNRIK